MKGRERGQTPGEIVDSLFVIRRSVAKLSRRGDATDHASRRALTLAADLADEIARTIGDILCGQESS